MLAIPVFRDRVAPVLNWSTRVMIVSDELPEASQGEELVFPTATGFELLRLLRERGVHTVICGALSRDLLRYAADLGLKVLCGISGSVIEVLCAYRRNQLEEPRFWLPGCRGPRRYRGCCPGEGGTDPRAERRELMPGGTGEGRGLGEHQRGWRSGVGCDLEKNTPGEGMPPDNQGFCLCPACGAEVWHQRGIPCNQMRCPVCDQPMVRK